ncbi:ribonuclease E inhibitor RraB [Gallaecimonas xiamenensis]|uniref:RNase E inhibitor protein n=1 Tax=Gallaecimonas xiamenensis 3-C-1 TaxID=745411 RepID=K2JHZ9_9GAMM|nr:ribonuclease E inhibitor RraB [Gallaecimonas xiamenensis]EKE70269.1 RNase E inhibitor protein [Gallaecimonas xiamenensis 3-C-1]
MSLAARLEAQRQDNQDILDTLVEDGADLGDEFVVEHHFASPSFDKLEKVAVEVFKLGFDVTDAEEFREGRVTLFCFDAVREGPLVIEELNEDTDTLVKLADRFGVEYDGWGTFFGEEEDDEFDEEDDEEQH